MYVSFIAIPLFLFHYTKKIDFFQTKQKHHFYRLFWSNREKWCLLLIFLDLFLADFILFLL